MERPLKGYYLVRNSDGSRFFISAHVDLQALDRVSQQALNDQAGWDYWIDYCFGLDNQGRAHWENLDLSDHFELERERHGASV